MRNYILWRERGLSRVFVFTIFVLVALILAGVASAGVYFWQTLEKGKLEEKLRKGLKGLKEEVKKLEGTKKDLGKKVKELEEKLKKEKGQKPVTSPQGNIKVNAPPPNDTITSPVTIVGEARVFEATLQLRVKDASGKVIGQGFTTATMGAPEWGSFSAKLNFTSPSKTQKGKVEVYTMSPATGQVDEVASIPVTLKGK